jgi:transcriptional regulator with XRE-family HTH domain
MKLGEKIRYLRVVEGALRGLGREMTQQEVVRAIRKELRGRISQSYLSQIESGARPHVTSTTRTMLARFFKVHPGYLVDDPAGYHNELISEAATLEDRLDLWLLGGAERFRRDAELSRALEKIAGAEESRRVLILTGLILETPRLAEGLFETLRTEQTESSPASSGGAGKGGPR